MFNNTKKTGFSLVELLVAMAIIAVLLGLVVFGIGLAQQNSRDTQRRSKVSDVNLALTQYQTSNGNFPTNISVDNNDIVLGNPGDPASSVRVPLSGATAHTPGATTASNTAYFYEYNPNGGDGFYYFCAQLEAQDGNSYTIATNNPSLTTADANTQCAGLGAAAQI